MIDLIATATAGVWPYLVIAFTVVIGYITAWFKGRSSGKKEAKADQLKANQKAGKEAKKRYEENLDSDNDDIANGL